jgi:hypothetical protein
MFASTAALSSIWTNRTTIAKSQTLQIGAEKTPQRIATRRDAALSQNLGKYVRHGDGIESQVGVRQKWEGLGI